ncbi:hypothetical protein [Marinomonas balearica]|uniref:Uncharacterized protein n=1 Tax=Marinomonas balearica TaxID=491947 RepID=A0A4R6MF63_9GAMM|nr:hypothetical protein [Marinomonas balearica]TDP00468.1 hypothetical protein DFP79_0337 [Marinomonas balearica]
MEVAHIWNSLEIIKLFVSMSTPMIVLVFGYLINRNIKSIEQKQWENQTIIQWRIKVFDEVSPKINDIYCFMLHIGNWKELNPLDVVARKRELDKKIHTSAALFSSELSACYEELMKVCFLSYRGWGKDAAIRVESTQHKAAYGADWDNKWDDLFVEDHECPLQCDIDKSYSALMDKFSQEIGIGLNGKNHELPKHRLNNWWS